MKQIPYSRSRKKDSHFLLAWEYSFEEFRCIHLFSYLYYGVKIIPTR